MGVTWDPAVRGGSSRASHINQFLTNHTSTFIYYGGQSAGNRGSASAGRYGSARVDQPFNLGAPLNLTYASVLFHENHPYDILVQLCNDSGGLPNQVLAQTILPWWHVAQGTSALTNVPIPYNLGPGTYHLVYNSPLAGCIGIDYATDGAWPGINTWNGKTWTTQTHGGIMGLYTGSNGTLKHIWSDAGAQLETFTWSSSSPAGSWGGYAPTAYSISTTKNPSDPINILSYDDGLQVASGAGTWSSVTNNTFTTSGSLDVNGCYALTMTASGNGDMEIATGVDTAGYVIEADVPYTFVVGFTSFGVNRDVAVGYSFYDVNGTLLETGYATPVLETGSTVVSVVSVTSPATANYATLRAHVYGAGGGEEHGVTTPAVIAGTTSIWSSPGLIVGNQMAFTLGGAQLLTVS